MNRAAAAPTLGAPSRPKAFAMPSTAPAPSSPALGPDRPPPRVALCEPDALLCALLGEWLRRAGFEPVRCAPAAPAQNVALVVADVPAPRQGGGACIAALRRSFPHARVLAVSAQFTLGMHGATTAAVELGADAVLAKPFAAKVFIDAVQAALFQLS
jgi:DNA-binding response OmpR family regulator